MSTSLPSRPLRGRMLAPRGEQEKTTGVEREEEAENTNPSSSETSRIGSDDDWKLVLAPSIRAGMLDPFETHPRTSVTGIDVLMKHCTYHSLPNTSFMIQLIISTASGRCTSWLSK